MPQKITPINSKPQTSNQRIASFFNSALLNLAAQSYFWLITLAAICSISLSLFSPFSGSSKAILIASSMLILIVARLSLAIKTQLNCLTPEMLQLGWRSKNLCNTAQWLSWLNLSAMWLVLFLEHKGFFA